MRTITLMIGDIAMCQGYSTTEFITDKYGLDILDIYIDDLEHYQNEFIVLVDGIPYKWNLYLQFGGE